MRQYSIFLNLINENGLSIILIVSPSYVESVKLHVIAFHRYHHSLSGGRVSRNGTQAASWKTRRDNLAKSCLIGPAVNTREVSVKQQQMVTF